MTDYWLCRALDLRQLVRPDRLHGSDELLTEHGLQQVLEHIGAVRSIVVLGSSHSAFSVAWQLIEHWAKSCPVRSRSCTAPSRGFSTRRARRQPRTGMPFTEDDICPATQRVNRLSGLRGDGRELWRRILGKPDTVPEHAWCASRSTTPIWATPCWSIASGRPISW